MDMTKVGSFLAELRKKNNMTQAELGEKLGVTNKTVSRWETGNYMPPVEMLEELSKMYGMTINEILSGKVLTVEEYKEMAETNIKEVLQDTKFTIKDKQRYYMKKWRKDNVSSIIIGILLWLVANLIFKFMDVQYMRPVFSGILGVFIYFSLNNRMMIYVEDHIYGERNRTEKNEEV